MIDEAKLSGVQVIVHFTPKNVFKTARYQHFIEQVNPKSNLLVNDSNKWVTNCFNSTTKWLQITADFCSTSHLVSFDSWWMKKSYSYFRFGCLEAVYKLQSKLNAIDPNVHQLLGFVR